MGKLSLKIRSFKEGWLRFGKRTALINIRALFTLAYFFVICPYSLIARFSTATKSSGWLDAKCSEGLDGGSCQY